MFGVVKVGLGDTFPDRHIGEATPTHGQPTPSAVITHHHLSTHSNQVVAVIISLCHVLYSTGGYFGVFLPS